MELQVILVATNEDGDKVAGVLERTLGSSELTGEPGLVWFVLQEGDTVLGTAYVHVISHIRAYVNIILLPEHMDHTRRKALGKLFMKTIGKDVSPLKLETNIPKSDTVKLRYFQQIGFKREGICRNSIVVDGTLQDQYYLGYSQ
jgi:L-amino acid N-acyltransferase YncA